MNTEFQNAIVENLMFVTFKKEKNMDIYRKIAQCYVGQTKF